MDLNITSTPKIKVLFDSQIYDGQEFGGISRMFVDINNEFNKSDDIESRFSVSKTKNLYLSRIEPYEYGECDNWVLSVDMLMKGDYDVFYPTLFSPYFIKFLNGKPFVMSVHDMLTEIYFPNKHDPQIKGKRELVKYAAAIEVPTEVVKKDLIRFLDVDPSKIYVVGRGLNENFGNDVLSERVVEGKYVLFVGKRQGYKRFDWFIKHSAPFFKNHPDIKLVCTGYDFNNEEKCLLNEYEMTDRAIAMKVNDIELATLYKDALFFVFPSECEGFGYPVLEAYKMGCIALLNNNECFKEITFGKGTFFDLKEDESNIVDVMEKTLNLTEDEKEEVLKVQYDILSNYSAEKMTSKIKDMIMEVLSRRK